MNWFAKIINGYTNLTKFWMRLHIGSCSFCMTLCSWVTVLCSFKWLVQGDHCVKSVHIWSALSRIPRKLRISPYLVQMREKQNRKNRISRISYCRKTKPISWIFDKILKDRHFSDKGFPTKKYLKCKNFSLEFWKYIIKMVFFYKIFDESPIKAGKIKVQNTTK